MYFLLLGIWHRNKGEYLTSMGYFEKSIDFSRNGKYLHEEAIAFEEYVTF